MNNFKLHYSDNVIQTRSVLANAVLQIRTDAKIKRPRPNADTLQALAEAKLLEADPNKKVYANFDELLGEVKQDV